MKPRIPIVVMLMLLLSFATGDLWAKKKKSKKKKKENVTKIISKKAFTDALLKLAEDEREPVASSTLVEKGRGEDYYSVDKMLDNDPETFWAEGAKGWGKNEWVAFHLPDGTTHVEIVPGAGKEQFKNFNRPQHLYLDIYLVRLKREKEVYKPKFKWLGRTEFKFKDAPKTARRKLAVKLAELAIPERVMYVGVMIIQKVYKGQFDDTSVSSFKMSSVWGEQ
ncbi:hypothetical protein ACFL2F_01000 [Myxococcota bacterium]